MHRKKSTGTSTVTVVHQTARLSLMNKERARRTEKLSDKEKKFQKKTDRARQRDSKQKQERGKEELCVCVCV